MTTQEIRGMVAHNLGDPGMERIRPAIILQRINDAQLYMCEELDLLESSGTDDSVADTREYSITGGFSISDFLKVKHVLWDGLPMTPISKRDIDEKTNTVGSPVRYYIFNGSVGLDPIPASAKTIKLYYWTKPATLTALAGTEVPDIDSAYHKALVLLATADESNDLQWMQRYEIERNRVQAFRRRNGDIMTYGEQL